mmetsp:Transcript_22459/g.22254  ORF Transcript_22459/g.22254 Transcript_22459/m.22254 type:complete len:195 (-) Transcript_22459:233-817(-)
MKKRCLNCLFNQNKLQIQSLKTQSKLRCKTTEKSRSKIKNFINKNTSYYDNSMVLKGSKLNASHLSSTSSYEYRKQSSLTESVLKAQNLTPQKDLVLIPKLKDFYNTTHKQYKGFLERSPLKRGFTKKFNKNFNIEICNKGINRIKLKKHKAKDKQAIMTEAFKHFMAVHRTKNTLPLKNFWERRGSKIDDKSL